MIIPSEQYQRELVASPSFTRALLADDERGRFPVLLIKARSIILKYIHSIGFELEIVIHDGGWIFYDAVVRDDPNEPAALWSVVEDPEEIAALNAILRGERCHIGLFNELGVNVATATARFSTEGEPSELPRAFKKLDEPGSPNHRQLASMIEMARHNGSATVTLVVEGRLAWKPLAAYHYMSGEASLLSFDNQNEGDQQERLAAWLTNKLSIDGVVQQPQVRLPSGPRELTDLLVKTETGAVLIESKSLTVLGRPTVPTMGRLRSNIAHHVEKAASQLGGAIRSMRNGHQIMTANGIEVEIDRSVVGQAVILVPDLSLLQGATQLGGGFLTRMAQETGYIFQIIDPADLLRVVQAAAALARETNFEITESMAFDRFLFERSQYALASQTPALGVLFRKCQE